MAKALPIRPLDWSRLARSRLARLIEIAGTLPALRKIGPPRAPGWKMEVNVVGRLRMTRLNLKYRGKNRPTDILSFPSPEVFRAAGDLGELIICLPVLKRQAEGLGHSPRRELDILLAHGLLHLLGLDHERGRAEARRMACFEEQLLERLRPSRTLGSRGLIARSR